MRNVLLVKYGEIAMRGKNRYLVENRLIRTIIERLSPYAGYRVYKEQGRLLVVFWLYRLLRCCRGSRRFVPVSRPRINP